MDCGEVSQQRIPVLKQCPRFLCGSVFSWLSGNSIARRTCCTTWSRRQGTPGSCSTASSEGASVQRASRTDRGSVGTEKQRHVGRVASAETPTTAECNSTRGLGVFSRKSSVVSASCVCGLSQISTFGQRSRTRRMHVRVPACLFGRPRKSGSAVQLPRISQGLSHHMM